HIDTGGADDTPDGALKKRNRPQEPITNYVSVDSVADFSKKIEKLGGKICMAKTAVPQMGYFAVCQDTEGNAFGLWESDANAKSSVPNSPANSSYFQSNENYNTTNK